MKILGIILTAAAVLLFGINKIYTIKNQKTQLKNTIYMLTCLKNIILNESAVLWEAFEKIKDNELLKSFFLTECLSKNLSDGLSFEESLEKSLSEKENCLNESDTKELINLSFVLGKYDESVQAKSIENAISYFQNRLTETDYTEKEKIPIIKTLTLSIFLGIIIVFM